MRITNRRGGRWGELRDRIVEWRRRSRSRLELTRLGDSALHDIGLSRGDAVREAAKPFWMG